jgi:hypothetical protein
MFGYSRLELIGRPVEMLVPVQFRSAHVGYRRGFNTAPSTRSMGHGRELYAQRKDGSFCFVEIGLTPLATPQGPMVMASLTLRTAARLTGPPSLTRLGAIPLPRYHRVQSTSRGAGSARRRSARWRRSATRCCGWR